LLYLEKEEIPDRREKKFFRRNIQEIKTIYILLRHGGIDAQN